MLENLNNLGFYDFLLPWLLFLALFFGILQGKKIISEDTTVNGVIAIVSAFLVAYIAHGMLLTRIFGTFGVVAAGGLILLIALGMFGIKPEELLGANKTALSVGIALIAVLIFVSAGGLEIFNLFIDSDTVWTVILLLVMVGAIAFIGGGGKS